MTERGLTPKNSMFQRMSAFFQRKSERQKSREDLRVPPKVRYKLQCHRIFGLSIVAWFFSLISEELL
jgi:hypothetical protein